MKEFNAPSASFAAPDEWTDASTYILVGPRVANFHVTIVVNRTPSIREPTLAQHVDKQIEDLKKLPGFEMLLRAPVRDAARPTVVVEFRWDKPGGPRLQQRQTFVQFEQDVYCLTATAPADQFASMAPVFTKVLGSFKPKRWTPPR
jgi:hypothetical protein